ncbi:MAG: hypothetical protein HKN16_12100 [Saprospiraceae bacterium]|nr:hypothetical protein [Saprospiraceae bacterium]
MKNLFVLFALIFSVSMFTSCVEENLDPTDKGEVAPTLPSMSSMMIPFGEFEDADTTGLVGGADDRIGGYYHWFYAASNLVIWHTGLALHMAVPVASFGEAFNHDAEYLGQGVWVWEYDVNIYGDIYTASLVGELLPDQDVSWEMSISKQGGFQNVLWYTGITDFDGGKGFWEVYKNPNNPVKALRIDFQATGEDSGIIRFTNATAGSVDLGDYIEYRADNDNNLDFDRAFDVYRAANDNLLEIQANEANENGRVRDPQHFGDNDWRCWDSNFMDINC